MSGPVPVVRTNHRALPADYTGELCVWDVDKTYLDSRFHSVRELAGFLIEFAVDKRAIAGAVPLLQALRRGAGEEYAETPLYFVSASPPQLGPVIERKLLLDGIEHDGIAFKDQLVYLRRLRPGQLRNHMSYKLAALLGYWSETPPGARWTLFGDDAETDAEIYTLFAEVTAGRVRGDALIERILAAEVPEDEARHVAEMAEARPGRETVRRIFIHLTEGSSPERFDRFGESVVACRDFLQSAMVLHASKRIADRGVVAVARELAERGVDVEASVRDGLDRGLPGIGGGYTRILAALKKAGLI